MESMILTNSENPKRSLANFEETSQGSFLTTSVPLSTASVLYANATKKWSRCRK